MEVQYVGGAGHFAWGFVIGAFVFLGAKFARPASLNVQVYGPFFPFALGVCSALPYIWLESDDCSIGGAYNLFGLYGLIHCKPLLVAALGRLNLVTLICGSVYVLLVWHYIVLVKRVRRSGWHS